MSEIGKQLVEIERNSVLECTQASLKSILHVSSASNPIFNLNLAFSTDLGERENFAELYSEMNLIETTLGSIEAILGEYQTELGTVSGQIQQIQSSLSGREHRIRNRKEVQTHLRNFINDVNLPKNLKKFAQQQNF